MSDRAWNLCVARRFKMDKWAPTRAIAEEP